MLNVELARTNHGVILGNLNILLDILFSLDYFVMLNAHLVTYSTRFLMPILRTIIAY